MASSTYSNVSQANQYSPSFQSKPHRSLPPQQQGHIPPVKPSPAPPGTFNPGTRIRVGSHNCVIDRYLSEGGFAHVYVVRIDQIVDGTDVAVLKRVAVPDKDSLANMRTEVDTMKRLKGHRHIVRYIDSHASHLKGGGYEVFLLMEYCAGGGLIDFMNTRLQNRLTEPEVLKIFNDSAEGVACMHYLQPPLLHRDLKIENILITNEPRTYKLCDFGSSAESRPAGQSVSECRLIEEDIQKHTTLQYRSPEMIDVFRGQPIDEKSDIWALGVLLYKLCYYTTPFEDQGQLAILNASFKYPPYPPFSAQIKSLIGSMLQGDPQKRPNIYEVVSQVCKLRGKDIPITNIYVKGRISEAKDHNSLPPTNLTSPHVAALVRQSPSLVPKDEIPQIVQMRRGRPAKTDPPAPSIQTTTDTETIKIKSSQATSDPFAALDHMKSHDEISARFPSVEQFSILHDQGTRFDFGASSPDGAVATERRDLNTRVMQKLADQAFDDMPSLNTGLPEERQSSNRNGNRSGTEDNIGGSRSAKAISSAQPIMISQGTMTSPAPSPSPKLDLGVATKFQVKTMNRQTKPTTVHSPSDARNPSLTRPTLSDYRSSSTSPYSPANLTRRSFDPPRPVSTIGIRPPVTNSKPRPQSTHIESNLDFLRDLDSSSRPKNTPLVSPPKLEDEKTGNSSASQRSEFIESSVEFLRMLQQESDASKGSKVDKRLSTGPTTNTKHSKRASITLPNTKHLLAGRFGEAFRRFEAGNADTRRGGIRTPSPHGSEFPVAANVSTDVVDLQVISSEVPAEIKREMEKRQLAEEERRVEAAAAEYKRSLVERGGKAQTRTRAGSIQRKVKALLDEEHRAPVVRSAEGYGKYTEPKFTESEVVDEGAVKEPHTASRSSSSKTLGYGSHNNLLSPENLSGNSTANRYARSAPIPSIRQHLTEQNDVVSTSHNVPPRPAPKPEKLRKAVSGIIAQNETRALAASTGQRAMTSNTPESLSKPLRSSNLNDDKEDEMLQFKRRFPSISGNDFDTATGVSER